MKSFKLYVNGAAIQEQVFDESVGSSVMVDRFFNDEPRKAFNDRFEVLGLSTLEFQKLEKIIGTSFDRFDDRGNYLKIFKALEGKDINGIFDLYDFLGFGDYFHIDEDQPEFLDTFDKYEYVIYKGESCDDYSAGQNLLASDFYAVVDESGKWIFGDYYEELDNQ